MAHAFILVAVEFSENFTMAGEQRPSLLPYSVYYYRAPSIIHASHIRPVVSIGGTTVIVNNGLFSHCTITINLAKTASENDHDSIGMLIYLCGVACLWAKRMGTLLDPMRLLMSGVELVRSPPIQDAYCPIVNDRYSHASVLRLLLKPLLRREQTLNRIDFGSNLLKTCL